MAKLTEVELLAEIEALRAKLGVAVKEKTAAQEMATSIAAAATFVNNTDEQPTGDTVMLSVCINPGIKDEKKQVFKDVEVPTYYYKIDLPAGAGVSLMTNGMAFYHGETYAVDLPTLVDLKSRVARTWDHEKAIHSENENAYRRPTNTHFKSAAAAQHGM